jgi:hypothetical protein
MEFDYIVRLWIIRLPLALMKCQSLYLGEVLWGSSAIRSASIWHLAKDTIHKVLMGGCDLSGIKKSLDQFETLYTAVPGTLTASLHVRRNEYIDTLRSL